tara:strand:+ start:174 stop:383 length:210 start_codon:yes stop_codon:yes gene_type:complete
MQEKKEFDGIEIGALWVNPETGVMTGKMGNTRLLGLPNNYKKKDSHPDIRLFVTPTKKKDDEGNGTPPF